MLWTMLNAVCFFICIIAALGAARDANIGFNGYAAAAAFGLAIGVGSTCVMWTAGERVGVALAGYSAVQREWYFRGLYLAAIFWILMAGLMAYRVASAIMRLLV